MRSNLKFVLIFYLRLLAATLFMDCLGGIFVLLKVGNFGAVNTFFWNSLHIVIAMIIVGPIIAGLALLSEKFKAKMQ